MYRAFFNESIFFHLPSLGVTRFYHGVQSLFLTYSPRCELIGVCFSSSFHLLSSLSFFHLFFSPFPPIILLSVSFIYRTRELARQPHPLKPAPEQSKPCRDCRVESLSQGVRSTTFKKTDRLGIFNATFLSFRATLFCLSLSAVRISDAEKRSIKKAGRIFLLSLVCDTRRWLFF